MAGVHCKLSSLTRHIEADAAQLICERYHRRACCGTCRISQQVLVCTCMVSGDNIMHRCGYIQAGHCCVIRPDWAVQGNSVSENV